MAWTSSTYAETEIAYASGGGADERCDCGILHEHSAVIYGVTMPIAAVYLVLIVIGVGNVIRFNKVNSMSKYLGAIYFWSLLSNLSCLAYLLLCQKPNTF